MYRWFYHIVRWRNGRRSGVLNVGIDIIPNPEKGLTACLLATGSNPVLAANNQNYENSYKR